MDTEQWLSNGLCYLCRRQEHCIKKCSPKKNRPKRRYEKYRGVSYEQRDESLDDIGWKNGETD